MSTRRTRAIDLLEAAGVVHRVHEYAPAERHGRERDRRPSYGREAVAALDVEAARLFRTLVVRADDALVLALVPVDRDLDLKAIAAATGARRAVLAEPADAERAAGSVIGAISPLATRRPMSTVIDTSAREHATILVSAGRRGLQVELAPDVLVELTSGLVAPIGCTT